MTFTNHVDGKGQYAFHMGPEHASREKNIIYGKFLIFMHKNGYRIGFQEIKIRPLEGFELGP